MTSLKRALREKAELHQRAKRGLPKKIRITQRELGEDLQLAYDLSRHEYPSMVIITKGWSDIIVEVDPQEMLSQPQQESLF